MLLAGYPLDENMNPIKTVDRFDANNSDAYKGDYFYLLVSPDGEVTCKKSVICSYQLYSSYSNGVGVLASRASLAAISATNTKKADPSIDFARWICTYGGGGNRAGTFVGTEIVLSNQSIDTSNGALKISDPDYGFMIDADLQSTYRRSPKKYWDDVFDELIQSTAVLDFSDKEIEFPLSGGKDSRLLLGLITAGGRKDRIRRIFTNGPTVSPEVRAAQMVCKALKLPHEHIDQTNIDRPQGFSADDKLLRHVHLTEGEMSLSDLTWNSARADIIQLHGIESGLRNVYQKRDLSSREKLLEWFDIHLVGGDKCQLYVDGMAEKNMDEVRTFIDGAMRAGVLESDIATLHRTLLRSGRWVGRTWRSYNDRFFAPYLFVNANLIKATYNCGDAARAREEFHFEMMRRVAPDLVSIPFYGQSWDKELAALVDTKLPAPIDWPEGTKPQATRPMHQALYNAYPAVREFLTNYQGPVIDQLLDRDKLASFEIKDAHPSFYLAFWNFIQIVILERTSDLRELRSDAPVTDLGLPSFNY